MCFVTEKGMPRGILSYPNNAYIVENTIISNFHLNEQTVKPMQIFINNFLYLIPYTKWQI